MSKFPPEAVIMNFRFGTRQRQNPGSPCKNQLKTILDATGGEFWNLQNAGFTKICS
jgi:hypothetical protein